MSRGLKYPWDEMRPGQCLFVPYDEAPKYARSIGSAARSWLRRNRPGRNIDVVLRSMEDGVRVWFVEAANAD